MLRVLPLAPHCFDWSIALNTDQSCRMATLYLCFVKIAFDQMCHKQIGLITLSQCGADAGARHTVLIDSALLRETLPDRGAGTDCHLSCGRTPLGPH